MNRDYPAEEKLHAYSHGAGTLLAILGFFLLLQKSGREPLINTVALSVYGTTLVLLFCTSTLYHLVNRETLKERLRILDHIAIYFLIAGTYTPVTLITLEDANGWLIFYIVWGIALLGTLLKLFFTGRFEILSLSLYLLMGWLIVFDLQALTERSTLAGLLLLAAGGAFYTIGILFYVFRKIPYNHLIWHIFVLGGAVCHWFYIYIEIV